MDAADCRAALAEVGLTAATVEPILGGWASWTFDIDGQWIARFPRNAAIAVATLRELSLLPELAQWVPFQVPEPTYRGIWANLPFFAYRRIVGRPIAATDGSPELFASLAQMLLALHEFPVDRAAELLNTGAPQVAWRRHFEDLWPIVACHALPSLDTALAERVQREYEHFVESALDVPYCLVHNDLGPEHILVSEATSLPVGMIDFEDSWIGDPAVDLVPFVAVFGADKLDVLTDRRDLGESLRQRMWFYRWMGSVHAIIYGVQNDIPAERQGGIEELRRRITSP